MATCRAVQVMIGYHSALCLQQVDDVQRGGFAQITDIFLVSDTQYQYLAPFQQFLYDSLSPASLRTAA